MEPTMARSPGRAGDGRSDRAGACGVPCASVWNRPGTQPSRAVTGLILHSASAVLVARALPETPTGALLTPPKPPIPERRSPRGIPRPRNRRGPRHHRGDRPDHRPQRPGIDARPGPRHGLGVPHRGRADPDPDSATRRLQRGRLSGRGVHRARCHCRGQGQGRVRGCGVRLQERSADPHQAGLHPGLARNSGRRRGR